MNGELCLGADVSGFHPKCQQSNIKPETRRLQLAPSIQERQLAQQEDPTGLQGLKQ